MTKRTTLEMAAKQQRFVRRVRAAAARLKPAQLRRLRRLAAQMVRIVATRADVRTKVDHRAFVELGADMLLSIFLKLNIMDNNPESEPAPTACTPLRRTMCRMFGSWLFRQRCRKWGCP